jgi:hypothetical protein
MKAAFAIIGNLLMSMFVATTLAYAGVGDWCS